MDSLSQNLILSTGMRPIPEENGRFALSLGFTTTSTVRVPQVLVRHQKHVRVSRAIANASRHENFEVVSIGVF